MLLGGEVSLKNERCGVHGCPAKTMTRRLWRALSTPRAGAGMLKGVGGHVQEARAGATDAAQCNHQGGLLRGAAHTCRPLCPVLIGCAFGPT